MATKTMFGVQVTDLGNVIETVEEHMETVRGKPFRAKLYRRNGLAQYIERDGSVTLADSACFYDCGSDGVSRSYISHRDELPTEEEKAAGRKLIQEAATRAMVAAGIW
ncbi:hypothetical protein [Lawsonibacter faecis]|uniref:Uncharacterized protein n=1 Tax=Lawsonibacter faecis TaxID=2763052 RepID=A0A8J6J4N5_9FIRM|nr:hypothetical protein [Lawsonibacter faecis]MBC5736102.1 hypothetical protein [Lawsonibacter faecis]